MTVCMSGKVTETWLTGKKIGEETGKERRKRYRQKAIEYVLLKTILNTQFSMINFQ